MGNRLKWNLIAVSTALLIALGGASFALSKTLDPYAWRGLARVCMKVEGEPDCMILETKEIYDTKEICVKKTDESIAKMAAIIQKQNPRVSIVAEFLCIPDRDFVNT